MQKLTRILLLEDSADDASLIMKTLTRNEIDYEFRIAMSKKDFVVALNEFNPDVILSDHSMPQFSSSEALRMTRKRAKYTPFILVTGNVSEEFASNIIQEGADDYILKDSMTRLPASIVAAIEKHKGLKEVADYKYALDQSSIVSITDETGVIIFANNNFCRISKYTMDELIGRDYSMHNSDRHPKSVFTEMWLVISAGKIWRGELRNVNKEGGFYWIEITIIPFIDESGKHYQYMSICTDITERKINAEELFESNQRFQYAIRASSDIIWELNFKTSQFIVHEGKEKNFAIFKGHSWKMNIAARHVSKEDRNRIKLSLLKAMQDPLQDLWQESYKGYSADNMLMDIVNHAILIRDENGKAIRVIGAITAITEKKNLEAALFQQQLKEQENVTAMTLLAQEKERNLIGQELHDNVNQILAGTKLLLSSMLKETNTNKPRIRQAIEYIREAINENRKIAHVLVTPDFEIHSLENQVMKLTNKMFETTPLKVFMNASGLEDQRLGNELKLTAYRIAQEQCTNILKYANAANLYICMQTINDLFEMSFADDGDGMEHYSNAHGIGLSNIQNRLSLFKGKSKITTSEGNGFVLEISVPL